MISNKFKHLALIQDRSTNRNMSGGTNKKFKLLNKIKRNRERHRIITDLTFPDCCSLKRSTASIILEEDKPKDEMRKDKDERISP